MGAGQSQEKAKKSKGKKKDGKPPREKPGQEVDPTATVTSVPQEDNDSDEEEGSIVWDDVARTLAATPDGFTPLPEFPLPDFAVGSRSTLANEMDPMCQDVYVTQATGHSMQAEPDLTPLPPRSKLQDPFFLWRKGNERQAYDRSDPFSEWRPTMPAQGPLALGGGSASAAAGQLTRGGALTMGAAGASTMGAAGRGDAPSRGGSVAGAAARTAAETTTGKGGAQKTQGAAQERPREQLMTGPPQRREDDWAGVNFGEDTDVRGMPAGEDRRAGGGGSFVAALGGSFSAAFGGSRQTSQAAVAPPGSARAMASQGPSGPPGPPGGAMPSRKPPALGSSRTLGPPRTLPPGPAGPSLSQMPAPPTQDALATGGSSFGRQSFHGGPPPPMHRSTVPTQDDLARSSMPRHGGGYAHHSHHAAPSSSQLPPGTAYPQYMHSATGAVGAAVQAYGDGVSMGYPVPGPPSGTLRRPSPPPSGSVRPPGAPMGGAVRVH